MIGKAAWNTPRMPSMVFEVIQPDLEINRRHAATLLFPHRQQCAGGFGQFYGGIRANSGAVRREVLSAGLLRVTAALPGGEPTNSGGDDFTRNAGARGRNAAEMRPRDAREGRQPVALFEEGEWGPIRDLPSQFPFAAEGVCDEV
jgi:hypothetical protein